MEFQLAKLPLQKGPLTYSFYLLPIINWMFRGWERVSPYLEIVQGIFSQKKVDNFFLLAASCWEWYTTKPEKGPVYSLHKSISFSIHTVQNIWKRAKKKYNIHKVKRQIEQCCWPAVKIHLYIGIWKHVSISRQCTENSDSLFSTL